MTDFATVLPAETTPKPSKAALRVQARIALVAQIIRENGGSVPTHLQLMNELHRRGEKTSKGTVMNDLFALGLSDARTAYGRPTDAAPAEPSEF